MAIVYSFKDIKPMESKRQKKYARLIQKDLGEIFLRTSHEYFDGAFITVTHVMMSPDLKIAKVYLSFMLVDDLEAIMEKVGYHTKHIRQQLANRIRKQARVVPELRFYLDDTEEVANKIESLFEKLDIPPKEEDEEN